jgi:GWxTD domain-containing protein
MNRTARCLTVGAVLIATSVVAQVSTPYRNWGDSAVHYLMMKQEKSDWELIRTDAEAKAFIELFWARRDPTPDTPDNELRQQMETRIAEADKRYGSRQTPGSVTDRGLVYALLGEPSQIVSNVPRPRGPIGSPGSFQRPVNIQNWIYKNQAAERAVGTKLFDVGFVFNDEKIASEFELDGQSRRAFESTALTIAKSVVKRPFLTAADLAPGADPERKVAFRLIVVADDKVAHEVLRLAQEGENFADLARKYSSHASAQQGGYVGKVAYADLTDDFKMAFAGKEPGAVVLVDRKPQFAIIRLLTEAEAGAAETELAKPK